MNGSKIRTSSFRLVCSWRCFYRAGSDSCKDVSNVRLSIVDTLSKVVEATLQVSSCRLIFMREERLKKHTVAEDSGAIAFSNTMASSVLIVTYWRLEYEINRSMLDRPKQLLAYYKIPSNRTWCHTGYASIQGKIW